MKVVKFSEKLRKKSFFEVVEFPWFSTENWVFSYISWFRDAAEKSRKFTPGGNYSPNVYSKILFWCYLV